MERKKCKLFWRRMKRESKRHQFGALSLRPNVAYPGKRSSTRTPVASHQFLLFKFYLLPLHLSEGKRGFYYKERNTMAFKQFKWERIKNFSLETICLNSKELDCAEIENIFAFKPKQSYYFPSKQDSVILLCNERSILWVVKRRLLDDLSMGHKAILCPAQCTETSCLSTGSCWKQLHCSRWSVWLNQSRRSQWDFKCSLFAKKSQNILRKKLRRTAQ